VAAALASSDHLLQGGIHIGGQEHFYLETQACLVVPKGEDGEMEIFSATQSPSAIQVACDSLPRFRRELKTFLFRQSYPSILI